MELKELLDSLRSLLSKYDEITTISVNLSGHKIFANLNYKGMDFDILYTHNDIWLNIGHDNPLYRYCENLDDFEFYTKVAIEIAIEYFNKANTK
jgi:hypothetical protein